LYLAVDEDALAPVQVPFEELSVAALRGVAEAFVLREGTEYGEQDFTLEQKVEHVIGQLRCGEAMILFDADSASVGVVTRRELEKRRQLSRDET
jgi:uncharacterized protein YheU (UPF0270 family)